MPSWKKVVAWYGDPQLNSLTATTYVSASQFIGPLVGTSSFATSASYAVFANSAGTASYSPTLGASLGSPANNQVSLVSSTGAVLSSVTINNVVSASYALTASYVENVPLATTASYALTASSANDFNIRGSLTGSIANFSGDVTASNLLVNNTITANRLVVQVITSSTEYVTGSTIFGSSLSNTHQFTGSVLITGSLFINNVDYSTTSASFDQRILNNSSSIAILSSSFASLSSSFSTGSFTGSFSGSFSGSFRGVFSGSLQNLRGQNNFISVFSGSNDLTSSIMYQSGSGIAINETNFTSTNPEALYVFQTHPTSINVITGKGNLNNYLQLNIQNTNQGISASSDVVATANNGSEFGNYIDMGINSENFATNFIGGPNDAYLYNTGSNLHIGNISENGSHIGFFVGGSDTDIYKKLQLNPTNLHEMTGSLGITGSLTVTNGITGSLFGTSSWAVSASNAPNYTLTSSFTQFTQSYYQDSASFSTRITNNSSSIALLSGSFLTTSASFATVSQSYASLSGSFRSGSYTGSFTGSLLGTASYAAAGNGAFSGSFSGSFFGNGAGITNISASSVVGLNLSLISSGSVTASTDPAYGFKVNSNAQISGSTQITGSLGVTGSVSFSGSVGSIFSANVDTLVFTGSFFQTGSMALTGSLNVQGGITGSLLGTASYALSALSSSYALSASHAPSSVTASYALFALTSSNALTASTADNFIVRQNITASNGLFTGTITAQTLYVQNITSSREYITGSTVFGSQLTDTHQFTGSVSITGSLLVNGPATINNLTGSLFGTASQAVSTSYAANSVTASYALNAELLDGRDSSVFATTGSNVFIGNQTVTGSLFTSGSNTLVGNTTLTGSLNITGSTVQVGNNTLLGNTTLSGSIIISGALGTNNPTVKIYGDTDHNGYIRFDPVTTNIDQSISASYIYVSGSTSDLYFTQNGNGYNNTTRLRWLEGNLYTGLLNGGLITTQSSTVYQISSGSGIIVDLNASLNDNPYPTVQYLNWGNLSASIAPFTASYQQAFVGIDSTGNIFAQGTPFSNGQFDYIINIGNVLFQNQSTINGVKTQPSVAYGFEQSQNVFNRAFGPLKLSGYTLAPSGSSTGSLVVGSGTAYAPGANYTVDPNEPYYSVDNGTSVSKIFRYYQSGSTWVYLTNAGAGFLNIDPSQYSNNGTLTSVGAGNWSVQRAFWFPNSVTKAIVVYYGNQIYATEAEAIANISFETFVEAPNTAANAIYLGAIIISGNGVFTNGATYSILPGGLFRQVGGSGGGGSLVTQTLSGLSDVAISGPTDLQPLAYSSTAAKWINTSTLSASIAGNAATATTASFANTASYVLLAVSASYATQALTASNANTASFVQNAQSASYVLNAISASYATQALTASNSLTASSADDFVVRQNLTGSNALFTGTITAQTLNVQVITSSVEFVTGSTRFGSQLTDTHQFTGSVTITGSLSVNNSPVILSNQTSSMSVLSSSYALTASYAANVPATASYALQALSSSYSDTASLATTASYAVTAAYAANVPATASYALQALSSSYALQALSSSYSDTSSLATTASYAVTAAYAANVPATASYALQSLSSSYALTASYAMNAGAGGISAVTIADEGIVQGSASFFDFTGTGVVASVSSGTASISISGGGGGSAIQGASQVFTQSVAATTWSFAHSINSRTPVVEIYDTSYNVIIPTRINNTGPFATNIYFDVAQDGYAIISTGGVLAVSGSNAILNQTSAATTWSFTHDLNTQYPVFTIYDSSDNVIIPERINAFNTSSAFIYFSSARTGKAVASLGGNISFASSSLSASYATQALSASYALTASYISGSGAGVGFPFSGSAVITGSLLVSQSFVDFTKATYVTGSFTGSFLGTGSYAVQALSASYATFALSASNAPGFTVNFTQSSAAATWSFVHNLNTRNPLVQVYDTSYKQIIPNEIVATDDATVQVRFDYNQAGYAVASNGGGLYITGSTSRLVQSVAAVTWSFTHNLGTLYPAYEIYNSSDAVIIPSGIQAKTVNTSEIYFATPTTGTAIANFSGINGMSDTATTASFALSSSNFVISNTLRLGGTLTDDATVLSSVVGSNNLFTQATGSFTSAFFKYTVANGSNARSGEVMAVWNGASVQFTDNSTVDIGSTSAVTSSVSLASGDVQFNIQTNTSGWRIKSLATFM